MHTPGYYRYPAIYKNQIVFVSEGDLWLVEKENLLARRLTHNRGDIKTPVFSPDGQWIACASSDEGPMELYVMPAEGGHMRRLTYIGEQVTVHAWTKDGIYFSSSVNHPFRVSELYRMSPQGGEPEKLQWGPVSFYHRNPQAKGAHVIQRHGYREFAYWKRYRGGTAGDLWIAKDGQAEDFTRLITLKGNLARPHIINDRVYFLSDHEGMGNIYSTNLEGDDLRRHSNQKEFFARGLAGDGESLIYHAGGDLYVLDLESGKEQRLDIQYISDQVGRRRKYFDVTRYLQSYHVHPKGHHVAFSSRGKPCLMGNWDGGASQIGVREGVRYRTPTWLHDGGRLIVVSDDAGEESLELYCAQTGQLLDAPKKRLDIGRVRCILPNPKKDIIALTNHRNEYIIVDVKKWTMHVVERSQFAAPSGFDWSPDGEWLCYSCSINRRQKAIKLYNLKTKAIHQISDPILRDESPTFDPEGKYIYFLSWRHFDPTFDTLHFELGFNNGCKPYAISLQQDGRSPFFKAEESLTETDACKKDKKGEDKKDKEKDEEPLLIDLEGIANRMQPFPLSAGEYSQIHAARGKIFFISHDLAVESLEDEEGDEDIPSAYLEYFDLETQKIEGVVSGVDAFHLSLDKETLMYHYQNRLRVVKVGEKCEEDKSCNRKAGWIDITRAKLRVNPVLEWRQMYVEAWRIQRDHYWTEDMSQIDWAGVLTRYEGLLDRVGTREEFSDVLWEMQGELGTSHAYVYGGDLERAPHWRVGSLGAHFTFDEKKQAYRITQIIPGDRWNPTCTSPFNTPGIQVEEGDYLIAINKRILSKETPPGELLINQGGCEVELEIEKAKGKKRETFVVEALKSPKNAIYRTWVESNRAYIAKQTKGKVGYVHIPDMSSAGYAEFHRSFLQELDKPGLVVDVRFNGGGMVSALLLEKLSRRRMGYDVSRWTGNIPYPDDSPVGPMVALTNEYAGSDGDMFSHAFKSLKLGPLVGKRTWGGVIGIFPRFGLVDGGMTTQPEYGIWFKDVGWQIENYGVDPDIVVENLPKDYLHGLDAQLDRALKELDPLMANHKELLPDLANKPKL